jgi:hypothetical protein
MKSHPTFVLYMLRKTFGHGFLRYSDESDTENGTSYSEYVFCLTMLYPGSKTTLSLGGRSSQHDNTEMLLRCSVTGHWSGLKRQATEFMCMERE